MLKLDSALLFILKGFFFLLFNLFYCCCFVTDPFFPLSFLVNSWFPGMLDDLFQSLFLCALLLFWLCVYHGIRVQVREATVSSTYWGDRTCFVQFSQKVTKMKSNSYKTNIYYIHKVQCDIWSFGVRMIYGEVDYFESTKRKCNRWDSRQNYDAIMLHSCLKGFDVVCDSWLVFFN